MDFSATTLAVAPAPSQRRTRFAEIGISLVALFLLTASAKLGIVQALLTNPPSQFSYAGIWILCLCSEPSRYEVTLSVLAGLIIRILVGKAMPPGTDYWLESYVRLTALIGFASIGALAIRCGFGRLRRQEAASMLIRILIFAVLGVGLGQIVDLASRLRPLKFDAFLYAIEQSLSLPYLDVVRLLAASPWLMQLEIFVYYSLPLGLAILYAVHLKHPRGKTDILSVLYAEAIVGFTLYLVYPACGPAYAFPNIVPSAPVDLRLMLLGCKPNCMPSLHFAGVLLIWWNLRSFTWVRVAAFAYLTLTALATIGLGEHYTIDLIAAVPFSLFIQAAATDTPRRWEVAIFGAAVLITWLALLRFAVPMLVGSHMLLFSFCLATIAVTWLGLRRLSTGNHFESRR